MANKRLTREEMTIIDITLKDGTIANILANDGNIYVVGNADIEDEEIQEEIEDLTDKMFKVDGKEVVNVIYSQGYQVYSILKKGSDAEQLLKDVKVEHIEEFIENVDVPIEDLV